MSQDRSTEGAGTGKVLVTGAEGHVARRFLASFRDRYELTSIDRVPESDGVVALDLLGGDRRALADLLRGHDTVVHCAHVPPPSGAGTHESQLTSDAQALYDTERRNVDMMQTILQVALEVGVRRVVAASSNQAAKWYEQPYYQGLKPVVTPDDYPRPDSFYGWAKVAYESLGFLYASGTLGRALEVVQLRIVAPRPIRLADFVGATPARYFRDIAGYLSERDHAQLFHRSVDTADIRDEHGVPFVIAYGTSANARRFWDLTSARRVLGFEPQDDSEVDFAREIRAVIDSGATRITQELVDSVG